MALALYAAGSTSVFSFTTRSLSENKVEMVETTVGTLANPVILTQQLALKGPSAAGNQRFTVSIRQNKTNSATNVPLTGSITTTLSIPKDTTWVENDTKNLCSMCASFLGACKAYGASGTVVSGATDTSTFPDSLAKLMFVGN